MLICAHIALTGGLWALGLCFAPIGLLAAGIIMLGVAGGWFAQLKKLQRETRSSESPTNLRDRTLETPESW